MNSAKQEAKKITKERGPGLDKGGETAPNNAMNYSERAG